MKYTNLNGLPSCVFDVLTKRYYDLEPKDKQISATTLINSPRKRKLFERYNDKLVGDISNEVWKVLGNSTHQLFEGIPKKNRIIEKRYHSIIKGWTITGKPDLFEISTGIIYDYKVTSTFTLIYKDAFKKWEEQLNVYAWLMREKNIDVKNLKVVTILRDWSRTTAKRDKNYPRSNIIIVSIPLWDFKKQDDFIKTRLDYHIKYNEVKDDDLPICPEKERWLKETIWSIKKPNAKKATKNHKTLEQANNHLKNLKNKFPNEGYYIEEKFGADTFCVDWCNVKEYCKHWKENYSGKN